MFTATLFFLGMAAFAVAASVCLSIGKLVKAGVNGAALDKKPAWDGKTTWEELKEACLEWYARCQEREAANRLKILSWARTFLLCAGLCLVGVGLQVEYDEAVSVPQIVSYLKRPHPVSTRSQLPQATPQRVEDHPGDRAQ